jgi:hypothetical protein
MAAPRRAGTGLGTNLLLGSGNGTAPMNRILNHVFGTKSGQAERGGRSATRRTRAVRPDVLNLEGRQLMSAFARSFETFPGPGPKANDMVVYTPNTGTWSIATAASGFNTNPNAPVGSRPVQMTWGQRGDVPIQNSDFFGTGHADLAVFRPSNGTWYIKDPISGLTRSIAWGQQGDVPLAHSDFDGDGRADIAVWRPSTGTFFVLKSSTNFNTNQALQVQWGQAGDVPIAGADYDGDGKTDLAVFRPSTSTWFVLTSSSGYNYNQRIQTAWGVAGDVPITNSDFDGDGRTDIAVFRPSTGTWFILKSSTGYSANQQLQVQWGAQGDVPITGSDFDGDGKTDIAVWRPSTAMWCILKSSTGFNRNQPLQLGWGQAGDMPLSNVDFDGDGKSDLAVFRPSDQTWWVLTSSSNFSYSSHIERHWGAAGDEAIGGPDAPDPLADTYESGESINRGTPAAVGISYASFLGDPLFASDGPSPLDVAQGHVGDCQTMAVLQGIAKDDPGLLRRVIVDMGNGTYAVDFKPLAIPGMSLGIDRYVVVDATLPVFAGTNTPVYAGLGHQNSLWVALMEEAWTIERPAAGNWGTPGGLYSDISGGGSTEMLGALGLNYRNTNYNPSDASWQDAWSSTSSGRMTVISTGTNAIGGLVSAHQYFVDQVNYGWVGMVYEPISMTLRNPWGGSNEFITVSEGTFDASVQSVASAVV